MNFEAINLGFDFVLLFLAFWMVWSARALGGVIGKSMAYITIGAVILGLAHLSETIFFEVFHIETAPGEFVHRLIILAGFIFLTLGLAATGRIVKRK